jgi:hypothetical protein
VIAASAPVAGGGGGLALQKLVGGDVDVRVIGHRLAQLRRRGDEQR